MTSVFSVRVANVQDAIEVTALLEASYTSQLEGHYGPNVLAKALPLMTKANPSLLKSGTYYVAHAGAELVGCGGWTREAPGSGAIETGRAHIRHVATHPNWVRRGVGRRLILRCFDDAKAAGIQNLECQSTLVAVDFYLATGFRIIERKEMKLGPEVSIEGVLLGKLL